MMLVQQYLMTHSLSELEADHGVKSRVCGHKVTLNYDQIEARDDDPISQECRGLILGKTLGIPETGIVGDTRVLARPFQRFFNLGQAAAAPVDLNNPETRFYEKMDGTLCIVYHDTYKGKWHVATRSVPEADLPIDGFGEFTFRTLFEKACLDTVWLDFDAFTGKLDQGITYLFELTTPLNRIVVDYKTYGITILGARNRETGGEYDPVILSQVLSVPHPPIYRLGNSEEMINFVSSRAPQDHEGIVVCDPSGNRAKCKNPAYVALNRVRDSVMNSPRGLVELILLEKLDDALPLLPQNIQDRGLKLRDAFGNLVRSYRVSYECCMSEANSVAPIFNANSPSLIKDHRKAFALAVQASNGWMAPMMDQYQGKCSGLVDWLLKKRSVDGGWPNSFLDNVLVQLEKA